ncbi:MAG: hypothetical protein DI585_03620 [Pseudomonas fluorescens]|nr:MAG: hypothetical protein DI585_03620 [Pseudomonas fluorescens]
MIRLFTVLMLAMAATGAYAQGTTTTSPISSTGNAEATAAAAATQAAAAKASASGASLELMAAGSKAGYPAFAGDVDVDFLRIITARNTEAIEMAKVLLKHSSEADVRMLAGDVIKARDTENRLVTAWLAKHGPQGAAAPVMMPVAKVADVSGIPPLPSAKIVSAVEAVVPVTVPIQVSASVPAVLVSVSVPVSPASVVISSSVPASFVPGAVYGIPAPSEHIINAVPKMELLDSVDATPVSASTVVSPSH